MTDDDIRARNVASANAFLDLLAAKDMEAWASLWAENAVQDMPFSPKGFPGRVEGKAAHRYAHSGEPAYISFGCGEREICFGTP